MQNSDKSYFVLIHRETQLENAVKNSSEAVSLRSEIQALMTDVHLSVNTSKKGEAITN